MNTLIDNLSSLNVCSLNMLCKINVDTSLLKLDLTSIHGFDNVGR